MGRFFPTRQKQYVPSLERVAKEQAIAVSMAGLGDILTSYAKDRWIDLPEANRKRGMETLGMVSGFLGKSMEMAIHADTVDVTNPAKFLKTTSDYQKSGVPPDLRSSASLGSDIAGVRADQARATTDEERTALKAKLRGLLEQQRKYFRREKNIAGKVKSVRTRVSGYNMDNKEDLMRARRELSQTYRSASIAYAELAKSTWGWGISQGYIAKEMQEGLAAKVHTIAGMAEELRKQMQKRVERPDVYGTTKPSGEPSGALPDRTQGFNASLNKKQKSSLRLLDGDIVHQIDNDGFKKNKLAERVLGLYQEKQKPASKHMLKAGLTKKGSVVIDLVGKREDLEAAVKNGDLVIMPGMRGELIKEFQVYMNKKYDSGLVVDEIYGGSLLKEVRGHIKSATGIIPTNTLIDWLGVKPEETTRAGELSPQQLQAIRTQSPMRDPRTGDIIYLASSGRTATDVPVTGGEPTPDALAEFERQQAEGLIPDDPWSPRTTRTTGGRLEVDPRQMAAPGLDVPVTTDASGYEVDKYGRRVGQKTQPAFAEEARGKRLAELDRLDARDFLKAAKVRVTAKGLKGIQIGLGIKGTDDKTRLKLAQEMGQSVGAIERFNEEAPDVRERAVHRIQEEMGKAIEKHNSKAVDRTTAMSKLSNTLSQMVARDPGVKVAQKTLGDTPNDKAMAMFANIVASQPKIAQLLIGAMEENLGDDEVRELAETVKETMDQDQAKNRAALAEYFINEIEAGTFRNENYGEEIRKLNLAGKSREEVRDIIGDSEKSPKISEGMVAFHGDIIRGFYKAMRENRGLVDDLKALSKMPPIRAWTTEEADHVFMVYMYGFERGLSGGKMKGAGANPLAVLLRMREDREKLDHPIQYADYGEVSKRDFADVGNELGKYIVVSSKRFKSGKDGGELTAEDYKNIFKAGMTAGKSSSARMLRHFKRAYTRP